MILDEIAFRFQNSRNIREKKRISSIIDRIHKNKVNSDQVFASYGEDAAAIQISTNAENLILMTTDAILPEFIQKAPFGAGFSAIYVGIDDIMACGGTPIACSTIVTYNDSHLGDEIFKGIFEATKRFKIPLVRGHTTTDSSELSLSSTIIGNCKREYFLSALGTQDNDCIAIIWDQDGSPAKANKNYWNTITNKTYEDFYQKREFLRHCISRKYLHACKDISNGGILGTLYQMLKPIKKGVKINLDHLEKRLNNDSIPYSIVDFIFLYLTSAFLISFNKKYETQIQRYVNKSKMSFYPLGKITLQEGILIKYENSEKKIQ